VGLGVVIFHTVELGPPPVARRFTSGGVKICSLPKPGKNQVDKNMVTSPQNISPNLAPSKKTDVDPSRQVIDRCYSWCLYQRPLGSSVKCWIR